MELDAIRLPSDKMRRRVGSKATYVYCEKSGHYKSRCTPKDAVGEAIEEYRFTEDVIKDQPGVEFSSVVTTS